MKRKGDTLHIGFSIKDINTHQIIPREEISDIAFQINDDQIECCSIEKLLSNGEISYDSEEQFYYFELSQEDTFKLKDKNLFEIVVYDLLENVCSSQTGTLYLREALNHKIFGEEGDNNDMQEI